jgi:hypothetical protein
MPSRGPEAAVDRVHVGAASEAMYLMDVNLRFLNPFARNSIPNRNACGQKRWAIDHFREGERRPTCNYRRPQKVMWVKVGRGNSEESGANASSKDKQTAFLILEKILSRLVSIRIGGPHHGSFQMSGATALH